MGGDEYERVVKSERSAESFLKRLCWENYRRFCIRCHSYRLYRLANNRYRCRRCGYTFHDFSGRWLNKCRIGHRNWLLIVKWFEREFSAKKMAVESKLSYPTILNALEVLRLAIITNSVDSEAWLDWVYFHTHNQTHYDSQKITVFGVIEYSGQVKIDILADISLDHLQEQNPKKLRRSTIFYTDEYLPYRFLLFHTPVKTDIFKEGDADQGGHRIDITSDFWKFMKRIIARHHGITAEKFPLYLKEIEFRYNHKDQSLFNRLCRFLVSFIPKV